MLRVRALLRELIEQHVPVGVLASIVERVGSYSDSGLVDGFARTVPGLTAVMGNELAHQIVGEEPFEPAGDRAMQRVRVLARELARRRNEAQRSHEATGDQDQNAVACALDEVLSFIAGLTGVGEDGTGDTGEDDADKRAWEKQRNGWRDLIDELRRRQQSARDLKALGSACSEVLVRELDIILQFIGTHAPDPRPPGEPRDLLRIGDELRRRIKLRMQQLDDGSNDEQPAAAVHDELVELLAFVGPLMGAPLPDVERLDAWFDEQPFYEVMQAYRHASIPDAAAAFEAVKTEIRKAVRK